MCMVCLWVGKVIGSAISSEHFPIMYASVCLVFIVVIHMYLHLCIYTHIYMYIYVHTRIYIYLYIYMYIYIYICIYIYMYIYVYIYMYIYIYMYVYIYAPCTGVADVCAASQAALQQNAFYRHMHGACRHIVPFIHIYTSTHTLERAYIHTHIHKHHKNIQIFFFLKKTQTLCMHGCGWWCCHRSTRSATNVSMHVYIYIYMYTSI